LIHSYHCLTLQRYVTAFLFLRPCSGEMYDDLVMVQNVDPYFLGNTSICNDRSYARSHLVQESEDIDDVNWWDIWVGSGIVAALLVKTCVTNFCLGLLQFADPFSAYDGEYEGPPGAYSFGTEEEIEQLRDIKMSNLRSFALGRICFWGILSNIFMFNLWQTMTPDGNGASDAAVCAALLAVSVVPLIWTYCSNARVNTEIGMIQNGEETLPKDLHLDLESSKAAPSNNINNAEVATATAVSTTTPTATTVETAVALKEDEKSIESSAMSFLGWSR
jgi:hypothetical protein